MNIRPSFGHAYRFAGLLCFVVTGCTETPIDLGNSHGAIDHGVPTDASGGTGGGSAAYGGAASLAGAGGQAAAVDGTCTQERAARAECYVWRGYAENYQFRSGSDRVTITRFNASGAWTIQFGTLTLPAIDAEHGYPQQFDSDVELLEGYAYPLTNVTETGTTRVTFTMDPHQFWADWCAIQTPMAGSSGYACVPQGGFASDATNTQCTFASDPTSSWDCTKAILCMADYGVCSCDANACIVRPSACVVQADLQEVGPNLDGSLILKCASDVLTPPDTDLPITVHVSGAPI